MVHACSCWAFFSHHYIMAGGQPWELLIMTGVGWTCDFGCNPQQATIVWPDSWLVDEFVFLSWLLPQTRYGYNKPKGLENKNGVESIETGNRVGKQPVGWVGTQHKTGKPHHQQVSQEEKNGGQPWDRLHISFERRWFKKEGGFYDLLWWYFPTTR